MHNYCKTASKMSDGDGLAAPTNLSVLEIIEMAFSHLPSPLVDEVKIILTRKRASPSSLKKNGVSYKRKYDSSMFYR
jgi:hypothetical protein